MAELSKMFLLFNFVGEKQDNGYSCFPALSERGVSF
jgi:hypothetical protein